ncbi:MAG TPA: archease [Syntrophales bacterium]|nr:archease [Syntrophales bacterium]HOL58323.1 archease [Syntrophales bacterium]HPO34492.1 archease [Syntrophales bacterium]
MRKRSPLYRYLDHTADVGCEVFGKTRRELYEQAALALFSLVAPREKVKARKERMVEVSGMDEIDLWVSYLRELLYLINGEGFLGHGVKITSLGPKKVSCLVKGEPLDYERHGPIREVKAVTYHGAQVDKTPQGWRGSFICDI